MFHFMRKMISIFFETWVIYKRKEYERSPVNLQIFLQERIFTLKKISYVIFLIFLFIGHSLGVFLKNWSTFNLISTT